VPLRRNIQYSNPHHDCSSVYNKWSIVVAFRNHWRRPLSETVRHILFYPSLFNVSGRGLATSNLQSHTTMTMAWVRHTWKSYDHVMEPSMPSSICGRLGQAMPCHAILAFAPNVQMRPWPWQPHHRSRFSYKSGLVVGLVHRVICRTTSMLFFPEWHDGESQISRGWMGDTLKIVAILQMDFGSVRSWEVFLGVWEKKKIPSFQKRESNFEVLPTLGGNLFDSQGTWLSP
jgi:hypothetical protein